jgi:hypothetical protein
MAVTTPPEYDVDGLLNTCDPGVERLYDTVQTEVPGVLLAPLKLVLWNTIEEFYLQSTLRREHVYWCMGPCVQVVDFNPFDAQSLVAWILDYSGLPFSKVEMPSRLRDLTSPAPATRREGQAWLALKPANFDAVAACDSPYSELWTHWFETILSGVLYYLFRQPAKPWSSPQLAVLHGKTYRRGIQTARSTAMRGYSAGGPVPFPYFASGHQRGYF